MDDPLSEGVTVRYRWTVAEMTEATRWHLRHGSGRLGRIIVYGLIALLVATSVLPTFLTHGYTSQSLIGFGLVVYLVALLGLRRWLVLWRMRRNYAKSSTRDSEVEWHITPAALQVKHTNGSSDLRWPVFIRAVRTPQGLLLYPQPSLFHWLPRSGFADETKFELVTQMAREQVPVFKELA